MYKWEANIKTDVTKMKCEHVGFAKAGNFLTSWITILVTFSRKTLSMKMLIGLLL